MELDMPENDVLCTDFQRGNRTGTITQRDGVRDYMTDGLTNRYTAIDSVPQNLFYDLAGNLTQDHDGYRYVYDHENRITRIYKLDDQTEVDVAYYAYDALGRRIQKVDAVASLVKYGKRVNYDGKKNRTFIILDGSFGLDNIFICLFDFTFCDSKQ